MPTAHLRQSWQDGLGQTPPSHSDTSPKLGEGAEGRRGLSVG